jgi:broad specificity phosphatase PhoE
MIYLLRHGQTEFNVARRYQGWKDSPLTARGRLQAVRMGERLASLIGDGDGWRIVASPLGRTVSTAEIIREALPVSQDLELDSRLAEIGMGLWDGLTYEELEARRPAAVGHEERYFHGPGGETYDQFASRLRDWLEDVGHSQNVIAVSHGMSSRVLRGLYMGMPRARMLRLDVPQDAVFRLDAGTIRRIECAPVN